VTELLASASSRQEVHPSDGKSTSTFERVVIDGQTFFLKRLSLATDWIMRASGDRVHRPYVVWKAGVMDRVPPEIDHTVVAMEVVGEGSDAELSMLMRDIASHLVPEGDAVVPDEQHARFIAHMARFSAHYWGWESPVEGLATLADRFSFFNAANVAREMDCESPPGPIAAAAQGWRGLPDRSPFLAGVAAAIHADTELLAAPMSATPFTFLHGDWKMGNLGSHPDGRTILLDWAYPGAGPACWDLCWYMALNRARMPESKEATMDRFRAELEGSGISTGGWFDTQLDLCLVGIMATFGWEKSLGDEAELRWWETTVRQAVERQNLPLP
jgi:hypothetical protein